MRRNLWWVVMVCAAALPLSARAAGKVWTTAISSSWSEPARWTPTGVPTASDSASFNKPGDYTVYFSSVFQELSDMALTAGTVTFERLVSPATLTVTNASGGNNLTVGNATLNLGQTLPVNVSVGNGTFINGGGTLHVRSGSNFTTRDLTVNPGAAFTVDDGSRFTQGRLVMVDGGAFTVGPFWTTPGANGALTAKNNAQVNLNGGISLGAMPLTVLSGADVYSANSIGVGIGSTGNTTLVIDGVGSSLTAGGYSAWGDGRIDVAVRNGATVNLQDFSFYAGSNSNTLPNYMRIEAAPGLTTSMSTANIEIQEAGGLDNVVLVVGNGQGQSNLTQTGASTLLVGSSFPDGSATFQVNDAGSYVSGTGGVAIRASGIVNIAGGSFTSNGPISNVGGVFTFTAGSLSFVGNLAVAGGGLLGANQVLNADRKLTLTGITSIDATRSLTLNGGTFNTGALVANGAFVFNSGKLGITGASGLAIGSGGPLGSNVTLGAGRELNVTQTMTVAAGSRFAIDAGAGFTAGSVVNQGEFALNGSTISATATTFNNAGLLRGTGRLTGAVANLATGVVRASGGEQLQFAGASFVNQGFVEAIGGGGALAEMQFGSPVSNTTANGLIVGANSLLRFSTGLTNQASLAFSAGDNHVLGDVANSAGGKIVVTGGAAVVFYDDVLQNGTFRVSKAGSTASAAVILGSFSGSGGSTGGGDIFFEGDLRPGNSPATVTFGNNVALGSGAELQIELGGAAYDQVHVAGDLALGGALSVSLIGGFSPSAGQSFDILDWGSLSGTFDSIELPALEALQWDTSQLYTLGVLSVAPLRSADFDEDGDVDGVDLVRWRGGFGGAARTHMQGDADGDGDADGADFLAWQRQLGSLPNVSVTGSSVPEPDAIAVILPLLALGERLRRRCR